MTALRPSHQFGCTGRCHGKIEEDAVRIALTNGLSLRQVGCRR